MQGYELRLNVYANNQQEADDARNAIIAFINILAQSGIAVSASKIAEAAKNWDKNPIVKNSIIKYFS